jgi:membrane associated rhomboid family serine protease
MADPDDAQGEMNALCEEYAKAQQSSILERYAYIPSQPRAIAYLTANFLHAGWLHLIFNMWFLWLAGSILEDTWGRVVYPVFYVIAGALALVVHTMMYPHSIVPTLGASGAVAGLMGAFLVRFPKVKIQMWWILFLLFRFRIYKFKAPAYALLPLWVGLEFLFGVLGTSSGVAHWAHVGGFLFGAGIALVLRVSGIEQKADQAIEAKVSWTADPRIVRAEEFLAQNQPDAAIAPLKELIGQQPDSLEAHDLLAKVYWRKQDSPNYRDEMAILCRLHVNQREMDAAWQDYEDYVHAGGEKLHKAIWMELCRHLETLQSWDRAASEYEKLARAYPQDRLTVPALVSAARIQQKKLGNSSEALRLYRAADSSLAPHLDTDSSAIRVALQELNAAAPVPQPS